MLSSLPGHRLYGASAAEYLADTTGAPRPDKTLTVWDSLEPGTGSQLGASDLASVYTGEGLDIIAPDPITGMFRFFASDTYPADLYVTAGDGSADRYVVHLANVGDMAQAAGATAGSVQAEVVTARGSYPNLNARIEVVDAAGAQLSQARAQADAGPIYSAAPGWDSATDDQLEPLPTAAPGAGDAPPCDTQMAALIDESLRGTWARPIWLVAPPGDSYAESTLTQPLPLQRLSLHVPTPGQGGLALESSYILRNQDSHFFDITTRAAEIYPFGPQGVRSYNLSGLDIRLDNNQWSLFDPADYDAQKWVGPGAFEKMGVVGGRHQWIINAWAPQWRDVWSHGAYASATHIRGTDWSWQGGFFDSQNLGKGYGPGDSGGPTDDDPRPYWLCQFRASSNCLFAPDYITAQDGGAVEWVGGDRPTVAIGIAAEGYGNILPAGSDGVDAVNYGTEQAPDWWGRQPRPTRGTLIFLQSTIAAQVRHNVFANAAVDPWSFYLTPLIATLNTNLSIIGNRWVDMGDWWKPEGHPDRVHLPRGYGLQGNNGVSFWAETHHRASAEVWAMDANNTNVTWNGQPMAYEEAGEVNGWQARMVKA